MSPICRRSAFSWICDSQQGNEQHSSIFEFGRRRRVRSVVNLAHRRDDRAARTRIEPGSLSVAYFLGMCARLRNPTEAHWSAATRQNRRAVTCKGNAKVQCMVGRRMHNANCEGCGGGGGQLTNLVDALGREVLGLRAHRTSRKWVNSNGVEALAMAQFEYTQPRRAQCSRGTAKKRESNRDFSDKRTRIQVTHYFEPPIRPCGRTRTPARPRRPAACELSRSSTRQEAPSRTPRR